MDQPEDHGNDWSPSEALELWKYFAGVGAADKNTMVTVESLLLGISMALLGFAAANLFDYRTFSVTNAPLGIILGIVGGVISVVSGYISLLYGGYAQRNWAQADAIARRLAKHKSKWQELLPEHADEPGKDDKSLVAFALQLARPCMPEEQLAPIFYVFAWAAFGTGLFDVAIVFMALRSLN